MHYLLSLTWPDSYTEQLTRLDAIYFSVTVFATVGFGDISPVSETARLITMVQMLANVIFVGVVARVLFGAALDRRGVRTRSGGSAVKARTKRRDMVRVEGGLLRQGSTDFYVEEQPILEVDVGTLWVDRHPVTNAEFRRFVKDSS